jgi:TonB family protein
MAELVRRHYPREYQARGVEGRAVVGMRVNPDGTLTRIRVVEESEPGFGAACVQALEESSGQWPTPVSRDGRDVPIDLRFTCTFSAGGVAAPPAAAGGAVAAPDPAAVVAPSALPAEIEAHVHLPGPAPDEHLFVRVSLAPLPWTITGCVTGPHGACEETARVELSEADRAELVRLLAEVEAIPRCEPEGLFPGDRAYRLALTGAPRPYEGHLPADPAELPARTAGVCRADARLAQWIAARFAAGR